MTLRFLLDANILSEPSRPVPNENVLNQLTLHKAEVGVASVVVGHGLILVTRNESDFQDFEGLSIENWFVSGGDAVQGGT